MKRPLVAGIAVLAFLYIKGYLPFTFSEPAQRDFGAYDIEILTFNGCGKPCKDAVIELQKRGVSFREILVDPSDSDSEGYHLWKLYQTDNFPIVTSETQFISGYYAPELAGFLAHHISSQHLTSEERRYLDQHISSNGMPRVVMYGASWCPHTRKMRSELTSAGIDFNEIDVEARTDTEQIIKTLSISGYPAVYVGYERLKVANINTVDNFLSSY